MEKKKRKMNLWARAITMLLFGSLMIALFGGCSAIKKDLSSQISTESEEASVPMVSELLDTTNKALAFVEEMVQAGAKEFTLVCSEEIYDMLLKVTYRVDGAESKAFHSLLEQAGVYYFNAAPAGMKKTITITDITYYPGCDILRSVNAGKEDELPSKLKKVLAEAQTIADACRTTEPLETAKNIQSVLCSRVRYAYMTNRSDVDTATGALLNGTADCDGYADAFYLVGNLAGLDVRYQQGISSNYDHTDNKIVTSSHMWNLLKIDGSWRVVDVCWADEEDGINYTWFNIGRDRASRSRTWQEKLSVPLLEATDLSTRPETEYSVTTRENLEAAIKEAIDKKQTSFTLIFDSDNYGSRTEAFDALWNFYDGEVSYYWDASTRVLTMILADIEPHT